MKNVQHVKYGGGRHTTYKKTCCFAVGAPQRRNIRGLQANRPYPKEVPGIRRPPETSNKKYGYLSDGQRMHGWYDYPSTSVVIRKTWRIFKTSVISAAPLHPTHRILCMLCWGRRLSRDGQEIGRGRHVWDRLGGVPGEVRGDSLEEHLGFLGLGDARPETELSASSKNTPANRPCEPVRRGDT